MRHERRGGVLGFGEEKVRVTTFAERPDAASSNGAGGCGGRYSATGSSANAGSGTVGAGLRLILFGYGAFCLWVLATLGINDRPPSSATDWLMVVAALPGILTVAWIGVHVMLAVGAVAVVVFIIQALAS